MVAAQSPPEPRVAKINAQYMFPIRPGLQNYLSGTMGELRSSHFHAGLDIKTSGVQGLEVYTSADGYVSRIKVAPGGYGNAIYVQHPNGTTTVYAHLRKYNKEIANYVRKAQYKNQSFAIELFPEKGQFSLKKGEVLGYSGNSGSSGGPHLHFEIRDGNQRPLNPLKQGFSEIKDNIPPEVRKVVLRTMNSSSRVNHQIGRFEFDVVKKGSYYIIATPVTAYGTIGVELLAHDKLNGANNRNGVPCIELLADGQQVFQQNIERFSFGETRNILVHTDYATAVTKRQRFAKLYVDDGNKLPFYKTNTANGLVQVVADSTHQFQINLWDIYNNNSQVLFTVRGEKPRQKMLLSNYRSPGEINYKLHGNDLLIQTPASAEEDLCGYLYANRMGYEVKPAYTLNKSGLFVWDLDQGLPDSLIFQDETVYFNYQAIMPGAHEFNYFGDYLNINASRTALFDTVFLTTNYQQEGDKPQEYFTISEDIYPLRRNLSVTLKPQLSYADKSKTSVYSVGNKGSVSYIGGTWKENHLQFKTRNWGTFTIRADTTKPKIKAARINSDNLTFTIKDDMSGIKSYRLEIDKEWVLMNYDYKKNLIWSEKLDSSLPFKGELELKVVDNVGNISYYRSKI